MNEKEIFDYYNANSNKIMMFGDWGVNEDGDIINIRHSYPIYSYQLYQTGEGMSGKGFWIMHIGRKCSDFDLENFEEAYDYAITQLK